MVSKELLGNNTNWTQLHVSDLHASVYFLEITQKNGAKALKKNNEAVELRGKFG